MELVEYEINNLVQGLHPLISALCHQAELQIMVFTNLTVKYKSKQGND